MNNPICTLCHTNKYIVPITISAGWDRADIRFGDNGYHQVKFFACGKCGTVRLDDDSTKLIKETKEKER